MSGFFHVIPPLGMGDFGHPYPIFIPDKQCSHDKELTPLACSLCSHKAFRENGGSFSPTRSRSLGKLYPILFQTPISRKGLAEQSVRRPGFLSSEALAKEDDPGHKEAQANATLPSPGSRALSERVLTLIWEIGS